MEIARTVTLSLVAYLRAQLDANGWTSVTIVDDFPEDKKVVTPGSQTGADDEVVVPAMSIYPASVSPADPFEIGGGSKRRPIPFSIYLYALTSGQRLDLADFLKGQLEDQRIPWYDYSATGYPPQGDPTQRGEIEIENVMVQFVNTLTENQALRYGAIISFRAVVIWPLAS